MTTPLNTLEADLNVLATADTTNPAGGTAQATAPLKAAQEVLSLLADQALVGHDIGSAVATMYATINTKLSDDVVKALQQIAYTLKNDATLASLDLGDATSALSALQNALQTAQGLMPGGSSAAASAFAATGQFATLLGNLLHDAGTVANAADTLYEIAQQLGAVAQAFSTAAQGNP